MFEIGAEDTDLDGVAQMEDPAGGLAAGFVFFFVEFEPVEVDVTQRDHAFDLRGFDLHIDAPLRQAADVTFEQAADLVLHIFHHLVLDGGALGVGGDLLAHRAVFAAVFVVEFVLRGGAVHIHRQQAVDHHIGIAADGRGEVRIELESQAVVPHIVGGIARAGHAAQGQ